MQKQTGSGNKGLDWVIIAGMIAAYPKTADLLSYWSPAFLNEIFGMDVSRFYGAFCAAMVEGTILFLHFDRRAHQVGSAQVVKWILIGISFACQIFDGFVTTDTIAQMSPELKAILTYGLPALPLIIAVMVSTIDVGEDEATSVTKPRIGLKGWINLIINGDQQNSEFSRKPAKSLEKNLEPEIHASDNGKGEKAVNFTNRQT